MANLSNHLGELDGALRLVQQRWATTCEVWNDRVAEDFAAQHWEPLVQQTQAVAHSLERLVQVVNKAQHYVK